MTDKQKKMTSKALLVVVAGIFLIIQIYPIVWVFIASLKRNSELAVAPFSIPKTLTFENYVSVLKEGKIWIYMWNSVKLTVGSLLLIISLSSTAGYALAKFKEKSAKYFYSFFTFGIMIPIQITLIPLFIFYSKIGILNTTFSLILPQVGFALPLSIMLFVDFFSFVPNELIEASNLDGCTPYSTFTRIMLPMAKNTFVTIASMYFILIWNDFIFSNTFISKNSAKTVPLGLKDYVGAFGNVNWGLTFAAISISILPPLVIYFILNKQVTSGMTIGATKG